MTPRFKRRPPGSNWGDFAPDDQAGRMNLITPARRVAAAREVQEGLAFVLSLPLDYPGGSPFTPFRKEMHRFVETNGDMVLFKVPASSVAPGAKDIFCDDGVILYTQYSTQWDGFTHVGYHFDADDDGVDELVYYNGYGGDEWVVGPGQGGPMSRALGIETLAVTGVQGRGVLVNLHAIHGEAPVKVGYDGLMHALDRQSTSVEPGDFLCLYTGLADLILDMKKTVDVERLHRSCATLDGSDERLLQWIVNSGLVAICADNFAVEHFSGEVVGHCGSVVPLHELCLFKQGIHLGELWYFRELANWLAEHDRSRFLLTAPPLRLTGCVGSPLCPVATV